LEAKITAQAPHRILSKELSDLEEMISSSFDLILTQIKQLENNVKQAALAATQSNIILPGIN
jgi:hypothetical protein